LRSFEDQKFVENYAEKQLPLFLTQFDTTAFAKDYKLSTQVAADETSDTIGFTN
jgi:tRNA(Ile)-lysidine synthase